MGPSSLLRACGQSLEVGRRGAYGKLFVPVFRQAREEIVELCSASPHCACVGPSPWLKILSH